MEIKKNKREDENSEDEGKWKLHVKEKGEKKNDTLQGEW